MDIIVSLVFFSTISVIILNFFIVLFAKDSIKPVIQHKKQRPPQLKAQRTELSTIGIPTQSHGVTDIEDKDVKLVDDAIRVIKQNYHNQYLTVEKIADELGTSKRNLQRKFKIVNNSSPNKELKRVRIQNALEGLSRGEQIKQVGFDAGFSSQSYFCKCFKDITGVTPSDFIKR